VYEKFLDGKRISPRHIMVELDGSEVYDVFYTWDTKSVFDTLRDGIQKRQVQTQPNVRGDRSLKEKIESPDSQDREEIEQLFAKADAQQRAAMLAAAIGAGDKAPIEVLRQAAFGLDPDLAQKARQGMLVAADPNAVDLIADTLQAPMAADERQALAQSLRRFASSRAQSLAAAHAGLAGSASALDGGKWNAAVAAQDYAAAATGRDRAADANLRQMFDDFARVYEPARRLMDGGELLGGLRATVEVLGQCAELLHAVRPRNQRASMTARLRQF
jgi:hypothetical protein